MLPADCCLEAKLSVFSQVGPAELPKIAPIGSSFASCSS